MVNDLLRFIKALLWFIVVAVIYHSDRALQATQSAWQRFVVYAQSVQAVP